MYYKYRVSALSFFNYILILATSSPRRLLIIFIRLDLFI